ncbi:MAG TPA: PQQ-dependent sugar dehydrogenase [Chitinophagaceae bacterium]|jgi:glucose/arabinose dehydrogenase|nr:PQQ-dependent sugar dehydrogenase [Chitinophagaceae bacterium]
MSSARLAGWLLICSLIACTQCKKKDNNPPGPGEVAVKDSVIVQGLNYPWEILWGPDNFIWMTERGGKISRVNPATGVVSLVHTISEVAPNGEGGLLGMVLHPDFATTPHVFVAYDYNSGGYKEKIVRFTYTAGTLTGPLTIIDNIAASSIHNGCRLLITPDLKLFITTGDASNQSLPQNSSSVNGKILRLNLDGTIPADNPVAGNPYWSRGHRNPQGLAYANNILYSSEHGPSNDDEVNIIEKGRNYGWPGVEGFCDTGSEPAFCIANNVREPLKAWTPTIAVCGMDFYNNDRIPQWKNSLLMVALKEARLYQLKLDATHTSITITKEYFANDYGRMRDVCVSPAGKVYVCTSNGGNDKIIEIDKN